MVEGCLKSIAGQVVILRHRPEREETDARRSRIELGEVVDSTALEPPGPAGFRAIELVRVPPGLEVRYVDLLRAGPGVISSSLNYTGSIAQDSIETVQQEVEPTHWVGLDANAKGLLQLSSAPSCDGKSVVVDVDLSAQHTLWVMQAAHAMRQTWGLASVEVLGLQAAAANTIVGLYQYAKAFARLREITCREMAVVMPVDFGRACLGDHESPAKGAAALGTYSIPLLELALKIALRACARKMAPTLLGYRIPAVFAAAGNREWKGNPLRHRLAYPALRPECIASTFCAGSKGDDFLVPSSASDLPIVHDLKPVLAMNEKEADAAGARVDGTSFAAPCCAMWWMRECAKERKAEQFAPSPLMGPIARQAALQDRTVGTQITGKVGRREIEEWALLVGAPPAFGCRWEISNSDGLIREAVRALERVNAAFDDAEFALTGSAAAMLCFQSMRTVDQEALRLMPGDIDVVYASEMPLGNARLALAKTWLHKELRGILPWSGLSFDLQDAEGRIAPLSQVQCIIPATSLFVTSMGILDVRLGLPDLRNCCIRVELPRGSDLGLSHPQAIVERYAQFPSLLGALTVALRLQKLAHRLNTYRKISLAADRDLSRLFHACLKKEGLAALTPSAIYRLEKLSHLLRDSRDWIPRAWHLEAPGQMMDVLRGWLDESWKQLSRDQTTSLGPLRSTLKAISAG